MNLVVAIILLYHLWAIGSILWIATWPVVRTSVEQIWAMIGNP